MRKLITKRDKFPNLEIEVGCQTEYEVIYAYVKFIYKLKAINITEEEIEWEVLALTVRN